uniref:PH domain-containing protein n=1 Tax=Balaenoptera musculus TaxID=9771 RepID=A0A8C0DDF5_BALMU
MLLLLFSGWQPRWFLLCGGILSYYDSPEDAWKGCKGSIQMAVCEIQVNLKNLGGVEATQIGLFWVSDLPMPCSQFIL